MELVFDFGKGRIEWTQNLFPKRQRILDPRSSHGDEGAAASEGDGTAGGPAAVLHFLPGLTGSLFLFGNPAYLRHGQWLPGYQEGNVILFCLPRKGHFNLC